LEVVLNFTFSRGRLEAVNFPKLMRVRNELRVYPASGAAVTRPTRSAVRHVLNLPRWKVWDAKVAPVVLLLRLGAGSMSITYCGAVSVKMRNFAL